MQFDLKKFFQTGRVPYHAELQLDLSDYDFPGYQITQPVTGTFDAALNGEGVVLRLSLNALAQAECARCLAPVEYPCSLEQEWLVRESELSNEYQELPIDEAGKLSVKELACEELVMEIPTVLLCSADCQGLCHVCGKPKAAGCTCCEGGSTTTVDERLAILKQLLN